MKRFTSLIIFMMLILATQLSFAEAKLTQPVVDLINSKKFHIRFSISSELDSVKVDKAVQLHMKNSDTRYEYTLVFDGQNALAITDSYGHYPIVGKMHTANAALYSNGESYAMMSQSKGGVYDATLEPNKKNIKQITHYVGSNNKQGKTAFEASYRQLLYYLLPLFPELNTTTDLQGQTAQLNPCTVFSRIGEANYGNQKYQFEEYKTPDDYEVKMTTRFYFKDGKLVKVIQLSERKAIDAGVDYKDAFGTDKVKLGALSVLDIFEITDTFNNACLQVPQGIKVVDFASPY